MYKKQILSLLLILSGLMPVMGGDKLSTTVTVGYDSRYVLYGYLGDRDLLHTDIWLAYPLNDRFTVNGGAWYGNIPDGSYEEIDGYAGLDYAVTASIYLGVQYSYFHYITVSFPTRGYANEYAGHISYWGEHVNASVRTQYDDEAKGVLLRLLAGYSTAFSDRFSLKIDAEAGYAFEYYIAGNAWNHAQIKASIPWQISSIFSVSPFVAHSIPLAAIDWEDDETYYGLSGSASF